MREDENKDVSLTLFALVLLHSAICPFLYAFNLKDFQTARKKLFMRYDFDLSLSNKTATTGRARTFSDLSYTYSCSDYNEIDENEKNHRKCHDTSL